MSEVDSARGALPASLGCEAKDTVVECGARKTKECSRLEVTARCGCAVQQDYSERYIVCNINSKEVGGGGEGSYVAR